jgi:hypothetical protein
VPKFASSTDSKRSISSIGSTSTASGCAILGSAETGSRAEKKQRMIESFKPTQPSVDTVSRASIMEHFDFLRSVDKGTVDKLLHGISASEYEL